MATQDELTKRFGAAALTPIEIEAKIKGIEGLANAMQFSAEKPKIYTKAEILNVLPDPAKTVGKAKEQAERARSIVESMGPGAKFIDMPAGGIRTIHCLQAPTSGDVGIYAQITFQGGMSTPTFSRVSVSPQKEQLAMTR